MTFADRSLRPLIDYFEQGCKKNKVADFGVEIEHIAVDPATDLATSYYGEHGIEAILKDIQNALNGRQIVLNDHLLGMYCPDYSVTLEPAAQFEISIRPCAEIAEIRQIYRKFRSLVDPVFAAHGSVLRTIGYQPASHVDDLKLIPKERYQFMDRFFQTSGYYGRNMMSGTASTQISIDYVSEADFVRKFRLAYSLGPLFRLLTDNVSVFEGAPVDSHLMRTRIWQSVDPSRCGIIPNIEKPDFGFAAYAAWLWEMPLILRTDGDKTTWTDNLTTAEVYAGTDLTEADVAHIVSMAFPDVRLKQYIEIRMADSLPEPLFMAYIALVKGLFAQDEVVRELSRRLPVNPAAMLASDQSLIENGFDGQIYGKDAAKFARCMLDLASETLEHGEKMYLAPFYQCTERKKTWAEVPYEAD